VSLTIGSKTPAPGERDHFAASARWHAMCFVLGMRGRERWRVRIWAVLGGLVAVSAAAHDAEACSGPHVSSGWTTSLHLREIPTDGAVIATQHCYNGCGTPPELAIVVRESATGNEVPGTLTPVEDVVHIDAGEERVFAWRSADELEVGDYQVDGLGSPQSLAVVAPVDVGFDSVTVTPTIQVFEAGAGTKTCCPSGPIDSCFGPYCYFTSMRRSASVLVNWNGEAEPAHFGQYVYRVTFDGAAPSPWTLNNYNDYPNGYSSGIGNLAQSFSEPRAEYCYTLEARSLADGTTTIVDESCVAHPSGAELGVFERDAAEIAKDLGVCEDPPAGLLAAWCPARAAYCEEYARLVPSMPPDCAALERLCPDGEIPGSGTNERPDGETEGDAGDAMGDDSEVAAGRAESRGCSFSHRASRSSAWAAALVVAIAAALRRRDTNGSLTFRGKNEDRRPRGRAQRDVIFCGRA
jgi:hypothetical protein